MAATVRSLPEGAAPVPSLMDLWLSAEASGRRLGRLFANRLGSYGMVGDLASALPVMVVAALLVFGSLFTIRLAQGEADASVLAGQLAPASQTVLSAGASAGPDVSAASIIVVASGDSLWSIAADRFPDEDTRRVVDLLVEANGGSVIQAGQQLLVPTELVSGAVVQAATD